MTTTRRPTLQRIVAATVSATLLMAPISKGVAQQQPKDARTMAEHRCYPPTQ